MPTNTQRVLAVAARAGRVGFVVVDNGELIWWEASEKASEEKEIDNAAAAAAALLREWITTYQPDCLVSENPDSATNKSGKQIPILQALASVGEDLPIRNRLVQRKQLFANAYIEAKHLAKQFPELKGYLPKKPKIWQSEPYRLVIFEALALAREAELLGQGSHNI